MAIEQKWVPELFENSYAGVNSAVTPELIQLNQLAWGINVSNRGAKPGTRTPFKLRMVLPSGLVQGSSYFSAQNGMGVVSIAGRMYRIRIQGDNFSYEQIPLGFVNSPTLKQVWMQQTVETLVIQDGQSDAILYNGGTARRAGADEVPRGKMMAYGNGRLWVAINDKELVAGDIRTRVPGSELFFTETDYLSGGGSLYFSEGITGLAFIPTTGSSDYGALMVYGPQQARSVRADITNRDLWAQYPGFVTNILDETGCAGDQSIVEVNQDLYWRDNSGGIRSIRSSLADESGPGNSPISREVRRITDFETTSLLKYSTGINFNNRLLMLASPFLNVNGGVSWKNIVPLDFAPVSTMRGKSEPSYDGQWDGLSAVSMFSGEINRKPRAFVISTEADGSNALWEIMPDNSGEIADQSETCDSTPTVVPIQCAIEHGRRNFGDAKKLKRLRRCDVYLYDIEDDVDLKVYWRTDNAQLWREWDGGVEVCAHMTDPESDSPHVWKNLAPQQRPQLKTFTIPQGIDDITRYGINTGYEFQIRLVWEGKCRIYKTVLWATPLDQPAYAQRDIVSETCLDNDVTEETQQLEYTIPLHDCLTLILDPDSLEGSFSSLGLTGNCDWQVDSVPDGVDPATVVISDGTGCGQSFTLPAYGAYTFSNGDDPPTTVRVVAESLFNYGAFCRTRGGIAEYCGFTEFQGCVSTPPKFYHTKTTEGEMDITQSVSPVCANPTNPGNGSCTPANCDTQIEGEWSISWDSATDTVRVRVGSRGGMDLDWFGGNCVGSVGWSTSGGTGPHSGSVDSPASPGVLPGTSVCTGSFGYGEWTFLAGRGTVLTFEAHAAHRGLGGTCPLGGMTFTCGEEPLIVDTWDITEDYQAGLDEDPPVCVLETENNSQRQVGIETPITIPVGSPLLYPGANVQITLGGSDPCATEVTGTNACVLYNAGSPTIYRSYSGNVEISLSNEDTPDAAMDRQFDGPDDGWGIWGVPYSGNCAQPGCCLAFAVEVEPGESVFSFQQAQFRIAGTGFDPNSGYQAEVQFWRRAHDSGDPYELFQTSDYSLDVQEDGTAEVIDDVPNEPGFDTYAATFGVTRSS